jgi:hypothetical protein
MKKTSENALLQNEVNEMKKSLEAQRNTQAVGQVAASIGYIQEQSRTWNVTGTPPNGERQK